MSYRFAGWSDRPPAIDVIDVIAVDATAYLGLWNFLASIDLVDRVRWAHAPDDEPLRYALADPRAVTTVGRHDALWMRVLDVSSLLGSRRYLTDGSLILHIDDRLGYAGGRYELNVDTGIGRVRPLEARGEYDLACDVADLAAFCLGTLHPATLHASGRLHEGRAGAVRAASSIFASERPIYCATDF